MSHPEYNEGSVLKILFNTWDPSPRSGWPIRHSEWNEESVVEYSSTPEILHSVQDDRFVILSETKNLYSTIMIELVILSAAKDLHRVFPMNNYRSFTSFRMTNSSFWVKRRIC